MPETAIQVICKDAFKELEYFVNRGDEFFQNSNTAAEYILPFRKIESRFSGDRYWPLSNNHQVSIEHFDYLTQVRSDWDFRSDF
ncbi:hypothetical protein [methanotrophic endosymbiont of Bathymodiolus puteoserpentis (Logatchev)]|jgi:hypothetical protein|uniref:hypothetical protein n=1 Tax=methanotrophic endosymbiont of Bathymodiolus puteoserpentis (Logatchev) TaxID=343235 RepID=UPI0013CBE6D9|nr:hypothetical protein [methanotrophic endosymbiont of Bathymodiolus puteoserpentis (Logatchev)]SHE19722.1 hypothetical protein BPUTEOMOX_2863 [methanotrophic endosymbiont of Bathymodiolus puteoserpentis (Logatchev)]